MTVQIDKHGEFATLQSWIDNATFFLGGNSYTCVDTKGRPCYTGRDMQRAHDEDTFPVSFGPRLDKVRRLKWGRILGDYATVACEFSATICGKTLSIYREHWDGSFSTIFTKRMTCPDHGKEVARKWFRKRGVLEDRAVRA